VKEVRNKLMEEVKTLEHELRVLLPREIKTALAMGDLRENAEYHAALDRQNFVKARIGQLRERLGQLNTLDFSRIPKDRVGMGSTVALLDLDSDAELTYELVLPEIADQAKGLISTSSPIGRGLLGKKEGDRVKIAIPAGQKRFEILELTTLHNKENPE